MSLYLNHFYTTPSKYYDCVSLKSIDAFNRVDSLLDSSHVLIYGNDFGLNKFYACQILFWNFGNNLTTRNQLTVNGVDIEYKANSYFIEINFNTHLNKEKMALIELIKNITSTKNVLHKKHTLVLHNVDSLTNQMQCRLRRIIETSNTNATYIAICSKLSKLMDPIISRFFALRIPMLENSQKTSLMHACLKDTEENDSKTITSCVKNNYVTTFQDTIMCSMICKLNPENTTKKIKAYQFVKHDIETLFKAFSHCTSIYKATDTIRIAVYKLIHYNLPHEEVAKTVIEVAMAKKTIFADKMFRVVAVVCEFDVSMIRINQCKIIHAYERMLFDIFTLTLKHVVHDHVGHKSI